MEVPEAAATSRCQRGRGRQRRMPSEEPEDLLLRKLKTMKPRTDCGSDAKETQEPSFRSLLESFAL